MRAVYAIRHQTAGIIFQRLYLQPPSADEVERVRLAHAVPGRECWARVVQVPIDVPAELERHFDKAPEPESTVAPEQASALPRFVFKAAGTVTPR